ncbi:hypothetical protein [Arthrobacter oryzae]|uniref:hypothetical protein n=1 Tax=Arthrobacter oryzae TaxID=409290 RepID=UPI002783221C|nr:hypothetical protein [Arthrobacter oryzae]MDQ0078275.1 hypothetical protein [Arthrobacter oryzae]
MTNDDRPSEISDDDESDPAMPSMGTLVIRTWHEPDQRPSFRARITYGEEPSGERRTVSTADPEKVLSVVRQWLSGQTNHPDKA